MLRPRLVVALVITATACSGSSTAQTTLVEPESTLVSGTDSAVTSTSDANSSTTVGTLSAAEALDAAVSSLLDSASYAFAASIQLNVQGTAIETEIEGWVDGPDRQLTLKAGGNEVTTTVKDGVAVVERTVRPPKFRLRRHRTHRRSKYSPRYTTRVSTETRSQEA